MTDDSSSDPSTTDRSPTRRAYLSTSAALLAGGLLAGCVGDGDATETPASGASDGTETPTATATDTQTATQTATPAETVTETQSATDSGVETPYSVSMEPVGTVEFESVPETWVANNGSWADMGVALGLDLPETVWLTGRYHTQYYDDIPGLSVDKNDMISLYQGGVDKELFYELDADLHVIDPNFLQNRFKGWAQADVTEVSEEIAPFFGNSIFSTGYGWHEDYQYYSLYEAFAALHEEFHSELSSVVPDDEGERPAVAIMWANGDEPAEFSPYLVGEGTSFKQYRDLAVQDALAKTDVKDFHSTRARIDFETLLKIDPEVIMLRGQEAKTRSEFEDTVVSYFEDHEVARSLTAVENGDVYRAGGLYQGPITNLVLTERAANQLYDADRELYDRERVADIVNGDL